MKAVTKILGGLALTMGLTGTASAAVFTLDEVFAATKLAVSKLIASEPAHAEHINGFKGWKSENSAKVIVYINHGGMSMSRNFTCYKHEAGIECDEQR